MSAGECDLLRGWKEIEAFLCMGRKSILRAGYPVRHEGDEGAAVRNVYALRDELLEHAQRGASIVNSKGGEHGKE